VTAPVRAGQGAANPASHLVVRLRNRSQASLAGFSSGQKAVVGVAILAVVIGGYLFMSWASKPSYVPLFSNLSSSDAAAITQKLSANKIPYQLGENGEQILVPQNDVYQQRLDMAAAGLPSSGSEGYSLLDTAGVTTSEFQQQVEYQQAVSDELQQTIESINGVQSAQVNVVIPQESLFATNAASPSASVLVSLQPGTSLSAEQVQAVVHLVASSIEGLSPDGVTVVDQSGDVLKAPGSGSANVAAGTMDQQETQSYDQSLDNSLQDMLATVLGPGNAVVQASAQLNFDQTQVSSQIYNPDHQAPIPVSQANSKETYMGSAAGTAAAGVLGGTTLPTSSAPGAAQPTTTTTAKTAKTAKAGAATTTTTLASAGAASAVTTVPSYTQVGSSQQNVVSEVTKTINSAPGALQRLTIAVAVNNSVKGVSQSEIKSLVSEAAGLEPSRGDSIQVAFVPFDQTATKQAAAQAKAVASATAKTAMLGEARDGLVVLAVIGLLVFALRRITKTTRAPLALPPGYEPLELEAGEAYESDMTMALPVAVGDVPAFASAPAPVQAEVAQIGHMIEQEPQRIAEMLRAWLEASPIER
jgi:flagellar M-ring protein FliF